MSTKPKTPGILKDPWREPAPPPPVQEPRRKKEDQPSQSRNEDYGPDQISSIVLEGYGCITVTGADRPIAAAIRVLEFCVDNRADISATFADYGVVIAKMEKGSMSNIHFYVQRKDGWLIAIPNAESRDAGCLQLIQAFLELNTLPHVKKSLEKYQIKTYKF